MFKILKYARVNKNNFPFAAYKPSTYHKIPLGIPDRSM